MRKAIVTFAGKDQPRFTKNLRRQQETLKRYKPEDVAYLQFRDFGDIGSEPQKKNPYAFKVHAINKARELGYDKVLWLDSAVFAIKDIKPVFDWLDNNPLLFFDNIGFNLEKYCNDNCAKYYGLTAEQRKRYKMVMACVMGFDFTTVLAHHVFRDYERAMRDGVFIGSWEDHRHDQTCISIILHKYGNEDSIIHAQSSFFAYTEHRAIMDISDTVCLESQSF